MSGSDKTPTSKIIHYSITVFDAGPMGQSDRDKAEEAADAVLKKYPLWLLQMAQKDHMKALEEGVVHFEKGNSLWATIEAEAESAAWYAIGYEPVSGAHLEIRFWEDGF